MPEKWGKTGGAYYKSFTLTDQTGNAVYADALPTVQVIRNNVTNGSWTITVASGATSGRYTLSGTIPTSYSLGDRIAVELAAIINSITTRDVVDELVILPANVYDSIVLGSDLLQGDVQQYLGSTAPSLVNNAYPINQADVAAGLALPTTPPGDPASIYYGMIAIFNDVDAMAGNLSAGSYDVRNALGKVLGGGTGTITAQGVWAGNGNGQDIATKAALESLATALTGATVELAAVPSATSSILDKIRWLFALAKNKITQTATTQTLLKEDGATPVAAASVEDANDTFTRGKFS